MSEQVARDLRKLGTHGDVVFRTDQEPALDELVKQVCRLRPGPRSCLTHIGVEHVRGNGFAKQAVQSFEGTLRAHKLNLEKRVWQNSSCGHPVIGWLVEHSVQLLQPMSCGGRRKNPPLNASRGESSSGTCWSSEAWWCSVCRAKYMEARCRSIGFPVRDWGRSCTQTSVWS